MTGRYDVAMMKRAFTLIVVGMFLLVGAGCGSSTSSSSPGSTASKTPPKSQSLLVNAAASLTEVFGTLGKQFEAAHPGTTISFNFGSSAILEEQIAHGAPADVFASADVEIMDRARKADLVGPPQVFASNTLELVVRKGNPLHIASLDDLTKADVVALCAAKAPCGAKAAEALDRAGVVLDERRVTRGQDVKATLRQVTAGDADAAIVYVTDARTVSGTATAVPIPPKQNVSTDYPIAVVSSSGKSDLARKWIAFVRGPVGQRALQAAGFSGPG